MHAIVTVKGQVVNPAGLRAKYGMHKGTRTIRVDQGDARVLKPIREQHLRKLQGALKGRAGVQILMEERRKDRQCGRLKKGRYWVFKRDWPGCQLEATGKTGRRGDIDL
jgi:bifunctional DNA-binding transcriptional regulator/antitoxin component of YhaV-PrlF toxin-antitoxin module